MNLSPLHLPTTNAVDGPDTARLVRRQRFKLVGPLFVVSALLAMPFGFLAFQGWFYIVPPILWILGMILLIGYLRTLTGVRLSGGFWWLSAAYNLLGCGVWGVLLLGNLARNETTHILVTGLLALWCGIAVCVSLKVSCRHELALTDL